MLDSTTRSRAARPSFAPTRRPALDLLTAGARSLAAALARLRPTRPPAPTHMNATLPFGWDVPTTTRPSAAQLARLGLSRAPRSPEDARWDHTLAIHLGYRPRA